MGQGIIRCLVQIVTENAVEEKVEFLQYLYESAGKYAGSVKPG